jgi:predicted metal-dependent hydrolase
MDEEFRLMADPRFVEAVGLFNASEWYACHDGFEELWHETQGPERAALQGILQVAVAHLHLERGNLRGATVLLGEGLGRLRPYGASALGLDLEALTAVVAARLRALQQQRDPDAEPLPRLEPAPGESDALALG